MQSKFFNALFAAGITFILLCLMVGMRLEPEAGRLNVHGATAERWTWIGIAISIVFLSQLFSNQIDAFFGKLPKPSLASVLPAENTRERLKPWLIAALIVGLLVWPFMVSRGSVDLATLALIYIMLGLGLNIVVGLAGLLDLGFVAFYAVGAYTYALLSLYFGLSFWVCIPIAAGLAALFGFILGFPVLRLRGDYLAIVTLGFGEIIRILLNNWTEVTGGPNGISSIPKPTLFGLEFGRRAKEEGAVLFHRLLRHQLLQQLQGNLPVPDRGSADYFRGLLYPPPDPHADRPRLGSFPRRRNRLSLPGSKPH